MCFHTPRAKPKACSVAFKAPMAIKAYPKLGWRDVTKEAASASILSDGWKMRGKPRAQAGFYSRHTVTTIVLAHKTKRLATNVLFMTWQVFHGYSIFLFEVHIEIDSIIAHSVKTSSKFIDACTKKFLFKVWSCRRAISWNTHKSQITSH